MIDNGDVIADVLYEIELMAGEDHCSSPTRLFPDCVSEGGYTEGVEACEGLIENEEIRAMDESNCQLNTLLVAVRQLFESRVLLSPNPETIEPAAGGRACRIGVETVQSGEVLDLLSDTHAWVQTTLLGHVPEALSFRVRNTTPAPKHLTSVQMDQLEYAAHGRRLAGAVRTKEAENSTWLDT